MKLHEYQAKQLFAAVHIPIPRGTVATTAPEASRAYDALKRQCAPTGPFACSVKAQLHAGGRGKAGGILTANNAQEAERHAASLLGRRLVTKQTGTAGLPVSAVLLEEQVGVTAERYLALTIDRFKAQPVLLASRLGGMEIEDVAAANPSAVVRERFDVEEGLQEAGLARVTAALEVPPAQTAACQQLLRALWELFRTRDASLIEINPLVVTTAGSLLALDAKVTIDDNALFRQAELAAWRDTSQEDPMELEASRVGISYVGLAGNIGCLVNGAGLAMATNDIIKLSNGEPANFLDVGGGANVDQVTRAFRIILADRKVTAVLVNIFGGIMHCDWIAQGLLNATQQLQVAVPIVVRLQGTNVEEGRRLLTQAKQLNLISVEEMADAARRVATFAGHPSAPGSG